MTTTTTTEKKTAAATTEKLYILFRAFKNCCYYLLPRQRHFTLKLIFLLTNFYRLNINGTFKNRYLYQTMKYIVNMILPFCLIRNKHTQTFLYALSLYACCCTYRERHRNLEYVWHPQTMYNNKPKFNSTYVKLFKAYFCVFRF